MKSVSVSLQNVFGRLTLREDHRLRVFDSRVLRGMFGPNGVEVTGG